MNTRETSSRGLMHALATNWEWSLKSHQPSEVSGALAPSLVCHKPPWRQAICLACAFVIPHTHPSRIVRFSTINVAAYISNGGPTRQNGLVARRQK